MKKIIILALVFVLALSFSACGGGNGSEKPPAASGGDAQTTPAASESTETPGNDGNADGQAPASLIAWMMDGTFSYDYTMISEGPGGKTEGSGSMAIDGGNMAVVTETVVEGQTVKSRVIVKGDITYMVDDVNKYIMKAQGGMNPTEGMMTDYSGIAKTGDGVGEINGQTLPYEEYAENCTGAVVRYYLDGGQVYGIETNDEGYKTVMIITNPSNSVPAGAFDLPEGYTEMDPFGGAGGGLPEDYLPDDFEMPDIDLPDGMKMP